MSIYFRMCLCFCCGLEKRASEHWSAQMSPREQGRPAFEIYKWTIEQYIKTHNHNNTRNVVYSTYFELDFS